MKKGGENVWFDLLGYLDEDLNISMSTLNR